MNNVLSLKIKAFREHLGYSQIQVADYLGVKREMISYYETGAREVPLETLNKLCDLFGIQLIDLLDENPETLSTNLAFAFRAENLESQDLNNIANFKKIVMNYLKMNSLINE